MKKVRETLTLKQHAFLRAYLLCSNATKAAIEAGYSAKNADRVAYKLTTHPLIKPEIEKYRAKSAQQVLVTFDDKVKLLWEIAHNNKGTDREDISIKAINEINKMMGHYAPERHYNENLNVNSELKDVQEIRKMYEKDI